MNVTGRTSLVDNFCKGGCNLLWDIWMNNVTTIGNNYCADVACNLLPNTWVDGVVTIKDNFCYDSTLAFGSCL